MSVAHDQPDYSRSIRPFWYDRYPGHVLRHYGMLGVAPHGATARWTYTVPPGRKAFLELLTAFIHRATVATTPGLAYIYVFITPAAAPGGTVMVALIRTNNIGDKDRGEVGHASILHAGDTVTAYSLDLSTDGTIDYFVAAKITEYDA